MENQESFGNTFESSEKTAAFYKGFAPIMAKVGAARLDGTNTHHKSKYSTRASVISALEKAYKGTAFFYFQVPVVYPEWAGVYTRIVDGESGEWIASTLLLPCPKQSPFKGAAPIACPQGHGSAITYAGKYSLIQLHALPCSDDDEGEAIRTQNNQYAQNSYYAQNGNGRYTQPLVQQPAALPAEPPPMTPEEVETHKKNMYAAENIDQLREVWNSMPKPAQSLLNSDKNKAKELLERKAKFAEKKAKAMTTCTPVKEEPSAPVQEKQPQEPPAELLLDIPAEPIQQPL